MADLYQGKQLDAIELLPPQRLSRSLVLICQAHLPVRHQKRLNPVVVPALADPIGD
ncbi:MULTISPECIES: hypothetical protein [Synechococcales]|uniref:hypothetical protein n=1 Tax=Synechococcales TaxID=1890424 RepID=UPI001E46734E|nr:MULTISPECIES: hypothetical protein [Synechococcales]